MSSFNLATQTAQATEDIRHMIEGIQGSNKQTVAEIERISEIIGEVNDIVTTIASAVEKQSVTTRDIATNVSGCTDELQTIAKQLNSLTRQLRNLVGRYKVK